MRGTISHVMLVLMLVEYVGAGGKARVEREGGVYDDGLGILLCS